MQRNPTAALAGLVAGCLLGAACANASGEPGGPPAPPDAPGFGSPVPLAGCESFEYGSCDLRTSTACRDNLAGIAACLRGGATWEIPRISFWSEAEAEAWLLGSLLDTAPPQPDYFELGLAQFGLTRPRAFEPEISAARLARRWAAFYRRAEGDIVVIDRPSAQGPGQAAPLGNPERNALVLHEMIHALQDAAHDLDAFARSYQTDGDGNLRGGSLIEGEAHLYEQRYYAALSGVDGAALDWAAELARRSDAAERALFLEDDLYSASLLSVPYVHGARYVERIWAGAGPAGVRALFDAPPSTMREVLATIWGGPAAGDAVVAEIVVDTPEGARLEAWSPLGAWALYLLARPLLEDAEAARSLALHWRADRFEVFSLPGGDIAARWTLDLRDAEAASALGALLPDTLPAALRRSGRRLELSTSSGEPPPWLTQ